MVKSIKISGKRLTELRESLHYSQEDFASLADLTRGSIARYEGMRVAGMLPTKFRKLAESLKKPPQELLTLIGAEEGQKAIPDDALHEAIVHPNAPKTQDTWGEIKEKLRELRNSTGRDEVDLLKELIDSYKPTWARRSAAKQIGKRRQRPGSPARQ